jgi:hypothetical protein
VRLLEASLQGLQAASYLFQCDLTPKELVRFCSQECVAIGCFPDICPSCEHLMRNVNTSFPKKRKAVHMKNATSIEQEKTEEDLTIEITDLNEIQTNGSCLFLWAAPKVLDWQRVSERKRRQWISSIGIALLLLIVLSMSNGLFFLMVNSFKAADVNTGTVCSALQKQQARLEQPIDVASSQLSSAHKDLQKAEEARNTLSRLQEPSRLLQAKLSACPASR